MNHVGLHANMPMVDFENLTRPVSADDPCGADLDLTGDAGYMNFVAGAEGLLPKSYFGKDQSGNEDRPFDRASIDFEAQFNAAKPFLEQTRDLRLLGILAKLCILNRDLAGFVSCIRAMSALLTAHWDDVHPRSEDGDFGYRMVALESIDASPTVIMPLQFLPLVEHKRLGSVNYRSYMIAKGELQPRHGEEPVAPAVIDRVLEEVELTALVERRQQFLELKSALTQINKVWQEKCGSAPAVNLERLPQSVAQIFTMLDASVAKRDPAASLATANDNSNAPDGGALDASQGAAVASVRIVSSIQAAGALAAVARYFSRSEPSSPALLLVRQASSLLGKSFLEVMRMLVPAHVEKAAVNIGKEQSFDLPIDRLSAVASQAEEQPANKPEGDAAHEGHFEVQSRSEALALLEQIGNYFRLAEPSSPIPFLTERARDLAQRDFLSVLNAILPANSLKPGKG